MFAHNKRLQYTVRVSGSNPGLANLLLEQRTHTVPPYYSSLNAPAMAATGAV